MPDPATGFSAGASVLGSAMGSNASKDAANAQAEAADRASANSLLASRESNALQKEMFDKQIELQTPAREAGLAGQNRLMTLLGLAGKNSRLPQSITNGESTIDYGGIDRNGGDPNDPMFGAANKEFGMTEFNQDPSYKWRLQQGQQALDRSASARGGLFGGRAAKDLMNYGQGAASQEYGNAFNRFQTNRSNMLNPLQSLAGMAQTANGAIGNAAGAYGANVGNNLTSTANQIGNNMMGAGNARASGYVGGANAINGGISQGINNYQNNQLMNKLFPQSSSQSNGLVAGGFGTGNAYGNEDYGQYF